MMSRLAHWWIDVHPPGEAFVVTTAPTTPQVEAILRRYMAMPTGKPTSLGASLWMRSGTSKAAGS
jgi:hypothetical protein